MRQFKLSPRVGYLLMALVLAVVAVGGYGAYRASSAPSKAKPKSFNCAGMSPRKFAKTLYPKLKISSVDWSTKNKPVVFGTYEGYRGYLVMGFHENCWRIDYAGQD